MDHEGAIGLCLCWRVVDTGYWVLVLLQRAAAGSDPIGIVNRVRVLVGRHAWTFPVLELEQIPGVDAQELEWLEISTCKRTEHFEPSSICSSDHGAPNAHVAIAAKNLVPIA